jgi:hypothetical protein
VVRSVQCKFPQCQYWDQVVPVNGPKSELGEKGEHGNLFSQRGLSAGRDKLNPLVGRRAYSPRPLTCNCFILNNLMVGERGFEPPTPWSRTRVSRFTRPCPPCLSCSLYCFKYNRLKRLRLPRLSIDLHLDYPHYSPQCYSRFTNAKSRCDQHRPLADQSRLTRGQPWLPFKVAVRFTPLKTIIASLP